MARGVDVVLNARLENWSRNLDRATQDLTRFQTNAQRTATSLIGLFSKIGLGITSGALASDILRTNIAMESLRAQLLSVTGSIQSAKESFAFIKDFAVKTPFEIEGLTKAFITLKNFGIVPTAEVMEAITNQAAQVGASQAQLEGIVIALGQAWTRSKLQGQEIMQLINQQVPVWNLLEKATGLNVVQLQKMSEKGELGRDVIYKLIQAMGELSAGSSARAMDTLRGQITNLSDAWHTFEDTLLGDRSEGALKSIVAGMTSALTALTNAMDGSIDAQIRSTEARIQSLTKLNNAVGFNIAKNSLATENRKLNNLQTNKRFLEGPSDPVADAIAKVNAMNANKTYPGSGEALEASGVSTKVPGVTRSFGKARSVKGGFTVDIGQQELDRLKKELALFGEVGEAARVRYEIESGGLRNVSALHKANILAAAATLDSYKEMEDAFAIGDDLAKQQREELSRTANEAQRLKDELNATFRPPTNEFEEKLARIDEALKSGILSAKEAKIEFDKIGLQFNQGGFDDVKDQVSEVSEFALQASRNLQSSLADAISSGFQGGLDGMLASFTKFLADAAAQAAASQLLELLSGKDGKSGVLGSVISGITALVAHDGAVVGATGGKSRSVSPMLFANAPRFHAGGRVGLAHDEVPAILQRGEAVLRRDQVRSIASLGSNKTFDSGLSAIMAKVLHRGGMVSHSSGPSIKISPQFFINAPKLHSGGGFNLKRDEVPAILQTGEMVLSRDQIKNSTRIANNSAQTVGGNTYNVAISVQSNGKESPDQLGFKIAESFIRAISKEEIASANRLGNTLKPVTQFGR